MATTRRLTEVEVEESIIRDMTSAALLLAQKKYKEAFEGEVFHETEKYPTQKDFVRARFLELQDAFHAYNDAQSICDERMAINKAADKHGLEVVKDLPSDRTEVQ